MKRNRGKETIKGLLKEALIFRKKVTEFGKRLDKAMEECGLEDYISCYHHDGTISIFHRFESPSKYLLLYLKRGRLSFKNEGLDEETFKKLKDFIKSLEKEGGI